MRTREERAEWAKSLRSRLRAAGINQSGLAQYLKCSRQLITYWIHGASVPMIEDIQLTERLLANPPKRETYADRVERIVCSLKIRHLLGKVSDGEIAETIGITSGAVAQWRRALGIKGIDKPTWYNWDEIAKYLGTMTDREFSKKFGVNLNWVCRKRKALGIKPFRKHKER